jgi:hypothetical protein
MEPSFHIVATKDRRHRRLSDGDHLMNIEPQQQVVTPQVLPDGSASRAAGLHCFSAVKSLPNLQWYSVVSRLPFPLLIFISTNDPQIRTLFF